MLKRLVRQTLDRNQLAPPNATILVAVSGGVDSVVLLHVMKSLAQERNWVLLAGHVNHSLRGKDADGDAYFVAKVCNNWGIELRQAVLPPETWEKPGNRQDLARQLRYGYLEQWAQECAADWIATAHHADDQAETFIERLARGAGLEGLSGIPVVRDQIIRPLLYANRAEIESYARRHGLMWRDDASNKSTAYRRNRIRHEVMPILDDMVGNASQHIAEAATRLSQAHQALQSLAIGYLRRGCLVEKPGESVKLDLARVTELPIGLRMEIWREAVRLLLDAPPRRFTQTHWEQLDKLAATPSKFAPLQLPLGIVATGGTKSITLSLVAPDPAPKIRQELNADGTTATALGDFEVFRLLAGEQPNDIHPNEAYFDADLLNGPLAVRNHKPGERIRLSRLGRKRVAKLLSEHAVPRHLRSSIPVLVFNREVIWVPGIRRSDYALIGPHTQAILGIKYRKPGSI